MKARRRARAVPREVAPSPAPAAAPPDLCKSELEVGARRLVVLSFALDGGPREGPGALTAAERAVLGLALAGRTNAEIASRRRTSVRTVANQLASVYRKLQVEGRRALLASSRGVYRK